ncbi:hypothetical protein BVC80_8735g2 [Macleaya cordata]|uniref:Uncharacterized protein n=1 Tax=Macleaya cordata TaxID=56857 RepID=A0A200QBT1_MACCD|nr:hypothetical protein BVC80_8735g2 [Macleaya cordata]
MMAGTGDNSRKVPKLEDQWTSDESEAATRNGKAFNAIYAAVMADEFRRISNCEVAKEE